MQVLKIDPTKPPLAAVHTAAETLRAGGICIYPTDTSYGIGVDPTNPIAMEKLLRMKGREVSKGVSLIVKNHEAIEQVAIVDTRQKRLLEHYLPGPYSFLLINKNFAYCPLSAVMIRIPANPLTSALAETFLFPYTTTSANFSGEPPAYTMDELEQTLFDPERMVVIPDLVLDGGPLAKNPPSTIVDLTNWPPKILRQGEASFEWQQFE